MGWRDELKVGDFVIVDRRDTWTIEMVLRETKTRVTVSNRDGSAPFQYMRSWGAQVGGGYDIAQWTDDTQAHFEERDERLAKWKREDEARTARFRKTSRLRQFEWSKLPDATLDAALALIGQEDP